MPPVFAILILAIVSTLCFTYLASPNFPKVSFLCLRKNIGLFSLTLAILTLALVALLKGIPDLAWLILASVSIGCFYRRRDSFPPVLPNIRLFSSFKASLIFNKDSSECLYPKGLPATFKILYLGARVFIKIIHAQESIYEIPEGNPPGGEIKPSVDY